MKGIEQDPLWAELEADIRAKEKKAQGAPKAQALTPQEEEKRLELFPARTDGATRKPLTLDQARYLLSFSRGYGLDPWLGHAVMYFGKPYITLEGRLYLAHSSHLLSYLSSHLASPEERKALGYGDDDVVWWAEAKRRDMEQPFKTWGVVTDQEVKELEGKVRENLRSSQEGRSLNPEQLERLAREHLSHLPVVKSPGHMAEKRAMAQALRLAFPLGLESAEEAGAERK